MMTLYASLSTLLAFITYGVVGKIEKTASQVITPQQLARGRRSYK